MILLRSYILVIFVVCMFLCFCEINVIFFTYYEIGGPNPNSFCTGILCNQTMNFGQSVSMNNCINQLCFTSRMYLWGDNCPH